MNSGSTSHSHLVHSDLDEQRFQKWLQRLQESLQCLEAHDTGINYGAASAIINGSTNGIIHADSNSSVSCNAVDIDIGSSAGSGDNESQVALHNPHIVDAIKQVIEKETREYPNWITMQKKILSGRVGSSSVEVKNYLRHVAFPHAIKSYQQISQELSKTLRAVGNGKESSHSGDATNIGDHHLDSIGSRMGSSIDNTSSGTTTKRAVHSTMYTMPMQLAPIVSAAGNEDVSLNTFMDSIRDGNNDGILGLCQLADVNHRVTRARMHDLQQVDAWIENESQRLQSSAESKRKHSDTIAQLDDNRHDSIIAQCASKFEAVAGSLEEQLTVAEREEEEARKAYEAAVQRRREAEENIDDLKSFVDTANSQKCLLQKIHALRLELDSYNADSAKQRIDMFGSMQAYVHKVEDVFIHKRLATEVPLLFDNLARMLQQNIQNDKRIEVVAASSASESNDRSDAIAAVCAVRVGLETLRVWKQLNIDAYPDQTPSASLVSSMQCFENSLRVMLSTLPSPSTDDTAAAASDVFKTTDSTVVLYFDHLHHATPEEHFEAQARVVTSLKQLSKRMEETLEAEQSGATAMSIDEQCIRNGHDGNNSQNVESLNDSAMDASEEGGNVATDCSSPQLRKMLLLNCNDVLSPPVWCLPLVHSPQYLLHLWQLAAEAHNGHLYVPLDFDTEWVSEDPYHASSDEDENFSNNARKRQHLQTSDKQMNLNASSGQLLRSIQLEDSLGDALGETLKQKYLELLTPSPGDHILAKVVKRMENKNVLRPAKVTKSSAARKRQDESDGDCATANADNASPSLVKVKTPYGNGTLIKAADRAHGGKDMGCSDAVAVVKLDWGATGYFQSDCVELIEPETVNSEIDEEEPRNTTYSTVQTQFVANTTGTFQHTNMRIHDYLCRVVNQLRVQRILADYLEVNHANLSLYLNGRTSCGLTQSIEESAETWFNGFHTAEIITLLDSTEANDAKGIRLDSQEFMRQLNALERTDKRRIVKKVSKDKKPKPSSSSASRRNETGALRSQLISTSASPRAAAVAAAAGIVASLSGGNILGESSSSVGNTSSNISSSRSPQKRSKSTKSRKPPQHPQFQNQSKQLPPPPSQQQQNQQQSLARNKRDLAVAAAKTRRLPRSSDYNVLPGNSCKLSKLVDISEQFKQSKSDPIPCEDKSNVSYKGNSIRHSADNPDDSLPPSTFSSSSSVAAATNMAVVPSPRKQSSFHEQTDTDAADFKDSPDARSGTSSSCSSRGTSASSAALVKQSSFTMNDDIRKTAKYTKDGERLRTLLLEIMSVLRMNFGILSKEYYRCFRYETTQSGVSAWFHFRGNKITFQQMNQCALFWLDDQKQHLSPRQSKLLEKLNQRMSNGEVSPEEDSSDEVDDPESMNAVDSAETTTASLATSTVKEEGVINDLPLPSADNEFPAHPRDVTDVTMHIVQQALKINGHEIEVTTSIGDKDDVKVEQGVALDTPLAASSDMDGERVGKRSSSETGELDSERIIETNEDLPESTTVDQATTGSELIGHVAADDSVDISNDAIIKSEDMIIVDKVGIDHAVRNDAPMILSAKYDLSHKPVRQVESVVKDGGIQDDADVAIDTDVTIQDDDVATDSIACLLDNSSTRRLNNGAIREDLNRVDELHTAILREMSRRRVSQARAATEANLRALGMGQPALSKFLSLASLNDNERGRNFACWMLRWIQYSWKQPAASDWDPSEPVQHQLKPPCSQPHEDDEPEEQQQPKKQRSESINSLPEEGVRSIYLDPTDDNSATVGIAVVSDEAAADEETIILQESNGSLNIHDTVNNLPACCSMCGTVLAAFANKKAFHTHLTWCYKRQNREQSKVEALPTGDNGATEIPRKRKLDGIESASADLDDDTFETNEAQNFKRFKPDATATNNADEASNIQPSPTFDAVEILVADSYEMGDHYDTCEVCSERGNEEMLMCGSCPCCYHPQCHDIADPDPREGAWFCKKCRKSGAFAAQQLDAMQIDKPLQEQLVNKDIFVYFAGQRCWCKAGVILAHNSKPDAFLMKWLGESEKTFSAAVNWVYLSSAPIRIAQEEVESAVIDEQGTFNEINCSTECDQQRDRTIRFETAKAEAVKISPSSIKAAAAEDVVITTTEAEVDSEVNAITSSSSSLTGRYSRLKDLASHGLEHIDGLDSGSVPPLVRAAANGIGGISALRGPEYSTSHSEVLNIMGNGKSDTYLSPNSLKAALCAAGIACRAVDIAMCSKNTNVFACTRPPGHHAGRYGCTSGCLSTGFCLLNNAAFAAIYGRVRWGLTRVAVVDIDVHFGNGTAELLRNDPNSFFASVHMIYGKDNNGPQCNTSGEKTDNATINPADVNGAVDAAAIIETSAEVKAARRFRASNSEGFYPALLGQTEVGDNYVSIGVYPAPTADTRNSQSKTSDSAVHDSGDGAVAIDSCTACDIQCTDDASGYQSSTDGSLSSYYGAEGFLLGLKEQIIPRMEMFAPELLVISAGFDGYVSDPLGGQLKLSIDDYAKATKMLMAAMDRIAGKPGVGRVVSILEGGYDTKPSTLGLAKCVDAHVQSLQQQSDL